MKALQVSALLLSRENAGIFESLRTYRGKLFRLDEHLDRFFSSAKTVGIKIPDTRVDLKKKLERAVADSGEKEAFVRLTFVGREILITVTERKHPAHIYKEGIRLRTTVVRRNLSNAAFPEAKSSDFMNQVLATLDPAPPGNYESLFLSAQGYLTEARIGNLFIICRGGSRTVPTLKTPPLRGILNGVTRRFVIECAHQAGISVLETPLMRHDVYNAAEAFLTNTSWEILPVCELDGRQIGNPKERPVIQKLQKIFKQKVMKECP